MSTYAEVLAETNAKYGTYSRKHNGSYPSVTEERIIIDELIKNLREATPSNGATPHDAPKDIA